MSQASVSSSTNQYDSRQAELIKACISGRVPLVRQLLNVSSISSAGGGLAPPWSTTSEKNTLRQALQRAAARGNLEIVQLLLAHAAEIEPRIDSRLNNDEVGALFRAAENDFTPIVEELLAKGANPDNSRDRYGRSPLAIAALSGYLDTVKALLKAGANPDAKDKEGKSVLLLLASNKLYAPLKQPDKLVKGERSFSFNKQVLAALVEADADLEIRDTATQRTALVWAAVHGKVDLVKFLLEGIGDRRVVLDACNHKGLTALHLTAENGLETIVELLLKHGANPTMTADGGWTALHNAAQKGHANVVAMLLNHGAQPNAALSNGKTALHWAAQNGHKDVIEVLLRRPETKLFVKDSYDRTPIICAAENGHDDIVVMLSPSQTGNRLSPDARFACQNFKATIIDFGFEGVPREKSQRRIDCTMFDLLYGWDKDKDKEKVPSSIKSMKVKPAFRWIHIPHNNVAWVEAMLTKAFVESGHREIAEYKALENCFGQEHRGTTSHASFMRPYTQRIEPLDYRKPVFATSDLPKTAEVIQEENPLGIVPTPAILVEHSTPTMGSLDNLSEKDKKGTATSQGKKKTKVEKKDGKKTQKDDGLKKIDSRVIGGKGTPSKKQQTAKESSKTNLKQTPPAGKLVLFMPFLHYETHVYRKRMSRAIQRASMLNPKDEEETGTNTPDDMLIKAYLNAQPTTTTQPGLHPRRTLDQFFYHGIDTSRRDEDQVVYRYCKKNKIELKVFMVDQLWMWILGNDLIVTCFPQRWQQPPNDPLNVLNGIIEDVDAKSNKNRVKSVYDLAMVITSRCSGIFDRHRLDDQNYHFLEMFESSLGHLTDEETLLFDRFNRASAKATRWLKDHRRYGTRRFLMGTGGEGESFDDPRFVDNLLDIRYETSVLLEIKDIRDELNILKLVLKNQKHVLQDFADHVIEERGSKRSDEGLETKKKSNAQLKIIQAHIDEFDRMDKQAEQIYDSLGHLLDLKQKHANAFEARFARDQAALTARQGQTIMVFTIVTIIFLPMSFIASVFSINVDEFPHDVQGNGQQSMPLNYLATWTFGIGFTISIPLIILAFAVDDVAGIFRRSPFRFARFIKRHVFRKKGVKESVNAESGSDDDGNRYSFMSNEKAGAYARHNDAQDDRQSRSSFGGTGVANRRDFSPLSDRSRTQGRSASSAARRPSIPSAQYNPHHVHFDRSSFERPRT